MKILLICFLFWPFVALGEDLDQQLADLEDFTKALELVEEKSLGPTEHHLLIDHAIDGLLQGQDPFSSLLTEEEFEDLKTLSSGRQKGIGLTLHPREEQWMITRVLPDSPAFKAGLKRGDLITEVNGELVERLGLEGLRDQEEKEKTLELTLSTGQKVKVKKDWFSQTGVVVKPLAKGALLIEIQEFLVDTPKWVEEALLTHQPKRVILDLRDNPGGLVYAAVEVAEFFVGPGPIAETRDKKGQTLETFTALKPPLIAIENIVILINRNSASASELLAQSLRERGVAKLVGERSFGKGVVQSMFPIGKRRYAMLTVARYYGPKGVSFHQKGLTPDLQIAEEWLPARWSEEDPIFQAGLKLLNQ